MFHLPLVSSSYVYDLPLNLDYHEIYLSKARKLVNRFVPSFKSTFFDFRYMGLVTQQIARNHLVL